MRTIVSGLIIGILGLVLFTSSAQASGSRWIYAGSNEGVAFYVDSCTICRTVSGDLSLYVRCAGPRGSFTDRLVIDVENRNYCWPDSSSPRWKGIAPDSILELIWACAYRCKYGR